MQNMLRRRSKRGTKSLIHDLTMAVPDLVLTLILTPPTSCH